MEKFATRIYAGELTLRLASGIHERAEKEFHTEHELFYLYTGAATVFSEQGRNRMEAGTLAVIPRHHFHSILPECEEKDFLRLTCHFDHFDGLGMDAICREKLQGIFFVSDPAVSIAFDRIKALFFSQKSIPERDALLRAYVSIALCEMQGAPRDGDRPPFFMDSRIKSAVLYIENNLGKKLELAEIAHVAKVAPSFLCELFRKNMQTSVHRYILNKRLITANKKIMSGTPSSVAAAECGFSDYSNFYVRYKKRFGISPSATKKAR